MKEAQKRFFQGANKSKIIRFLSQAKRKHTPSDAELKTKGLLSSKVELEKMEQEFPSDVELLLSYAIDDHQEKWRILSVILLFAFGTRCIQPMHLQRIKNLGLSCKRCLLGLPL